MINSYNWNSYTYIGQVFFGLNPASVIPYLCHFLSISTLCITDKSFWLTFWLLYIVLRCIIDLEIRNTWADQHLPIPGSWREGLELLVRLIHSVSLRLYWEVAVIVPHSERWLTSSVHAGIYEIFDNGGCFC